MIFILVWTDFYISKNQLNNQKGYIYDNSDNNIENNIENNIKNKNNIIGFINNYHEDYLNIITFGKDCQKQKYDLILVNNITEENVLFYKRKTFII